ncbi:MAG: FHA domain-containing protein [Armatimonas sp.]
MNVPSRVILFTVAGALAGLLTWAWIDLFRILPIPDTMRQLTTTEQRNYQLVGIMWGAFLGVLLGVADNLAQGQRDWLKTVLFGVIVGLVAGGLGLNFGGALFSLLYTYPAKNPFHFFGNVVARGLGWALIGALAGTADGWRKLSFRVGRNGFLGGLVGGVLGGTTFEIVPYLMPGINPGPTSRFFGFLITGAMIGLFIALVQQLLKEAWVRVVLGRNEGKEILVEKAETKIGRSELSDIPLYGDPTIAKTHAILASQPGGTWVLRDVSGGAGVRVNEAPVAQEIRVKSGDQIQIGSKLMVFYEKSVKQYTARENRDVKRPSPNAPPMPGTSPYNLRGSEPPITGGQGGRNAGMQTQGFSGGMQTQTQGFSGGGFANPIGGTLTVVAGPHAGQSFPLSPGATIGRDPAAGIPIAADNKASRSHARFVPEAGGWVIEDMNSTNGTFVNGQRITRVALAPGDTIVIGSSTLRYG